jgi:opacity protein-like surface antigen
VKRFIALSAVLALGGATAVADAAPPSPGSGTWKGFVAKDGNDGISFHLSERGSKVRISALRIKTDAQCEDTNPGGAVSIRRLYIRLKPGTIRRGQGFTSSGTRELAGSDRKQAFVLTVRFTGTRTATASVRVRDDVTSGSPLRCRSSFRVKPRLR